MLVDCPHCYTRVVPKSDGTCPACQREMALEDGVRSTWTTMKISQGAHLPPVCCECGSRTRRYVHVDADTGSGPKAWLEIIASLTSWPSTLWMFWQTMKRTSCVRVRMPQCSECGRSGKPKPRRVDFPNATMTFVVHRRFQHAVTSEEEGAA